MKVDYHVHPNLPSANAGRRLAAYWRAIGEQGIDALICAEHTFKDAAGAYRRLTEAKPAHVRTQVFPGAELVTGDGKGIDVIAFAQEDWYDRHPRLLEPFSMSLPEMLSYLEASELCYFLPHPMIPWTPLHDLYPTDEAMHELLASVPAFEAFNGCNVQLEQLCAARPLRRMLATVRSRLHEQTRPACAADARSHRFLAVGSDAHHPQDLGCAVHIPGEPGDRADVFARIIANTDISRVCIPRVKRPFRRLMRSKATTVREGLMKKCYRLQQGGATAMQRLRPPRRATA